MDSAEKALENLNRGFEDQIRAIDAGDPTIDAAIKNELKIGILENWKNSLVKYTTECVRTIDSSASFLDKSISDSSDEASKVQKFRANSSQDYRNFTEQVAALKQIIVEMGSRSQKVLIELNCIAKSFENQLHLNKSLSQEISSLKSSLNSVQNETKHYNNQLLDRILSNMKEETVDLKRFFIEYEKRMQFTEKQSSWQSDEMTRHLETLENELTSKNKQINDLTISLQQFSKPSAASTMIDSQITRGSYSIAAKTNSAPESARNIEITMHESYEISLTDVEASDEKKIRTLEDGARTMAKLLKEKHKMLRDQKGIIQELREELEQKQTKESRVTIDHLQTTLNDIKVKNTNLTKECDMLRAKSGDYDKLRYQMTHMTIEKKLHEGKVAQKISALEEQIQKFNEERRRLTQTNHDLFSSISAAYKELGKCISKAVE